MPFRYGYPLSVIFIGGCVCPLGMSDIHWGLIRMKPVLWKKIVGVIAVVFVLLLLAFLFFADKPEKQATYDLNHDGIMESYHLTRGELLLSPMASTGVPRRNGIFNLLLWVM